MKQIKNVIKAYGIALTGGVATGKSFVSSVLRNENFLVFDADIFSRDVCRPGRRAYNEIRSSFGDSVLRSQDLTLDRQKLSQIVFSDEKKRKILEGIIHPEIEKRFLEEVERSGLVQKPRLFFYEASLIFERNRQKDFKEVWLLGCKKETQLKRLKERSPHLDEIFIEKLLNSQGSFEMKKDKADFTINTDRPKQKIEEMILHRVKVKSSF